MSVDSERLGNVFAYALAVAAEGDGYSRGLGAIHLLKYAYLADLAFAGSRTGGGRGFTGIAWRFHHFGPYSADAFREIEPTVRHLGAREDRFAGAEGEAVRWTLELEDADAESFGKALPAVVALSIKREVKRYGADTPSLLHHVYDTLPVRLGRPGDLLDLAASEPSEGPQGTPSAEVAPPASNGDGSVRISRKATLRREAALETARAKMAVALGNSKRRVPPSPAPRYDAVFADGANWLESLAGEPVPVQSGTVTIDPSIWDHPRVGKLPR